MKNKNKKQCDWTMFMIKTIMVIIVLAVLCCVAGFFFPIFKYPNEDSQVITFLGALAAFVVISNYALMVEIRNKTNRELDKMREELIKMSERIKSINSNYSVEIHKIMDGIENAPDDSSVIALLRKLRVYTTKDTDIRFEIIGVLNSVLGKASQSYDIAMEVEDVAISISPMNEPENKVLPTLGLFGDELLWLCLLKGKPKIGLIGYSIMKRVALITKDKSEAKNSLENMKKKFSDSIIIRFLDTLIKDLDNSNLSWPRFDKDVQEWFDKNGNN